MISKLQMKYKLNSNTKVRDIFKKNQKDLLIIVLDIYKEILAEI